MVQPIDNQLAVNRSVELAKESSAQLKKNDLMQDFAAVQAEQMIRREQSMVARLSNTEAAAMRTDKDGSNSGGDGSASEREGDGADGGFVVEEDPEEARFVLDTNTTIDTKV